MVYPGAGYITMAIEAMRQLHASGAVVLGYLVEEVEILPYLPDPCAYEGWRMV